MNAPFFGVRLKLTRAVALFDALKAQIDTFLGRKPYRAVFELNSDRNELFARVSVAEQHPAVLSVLIGEILHNARCALDYAIWDLVCGNTGETPAENTKIQFPIFLTAAGFDSRAKNYLKGVSGPARKIIEDAQPFKTREHAKSPLWHLHQLSNWDKHRTLHLTGALLKSATIVHPPLESTGVQDTGQSHHLTVAGLGPLEDGAPLYRMRLPPSYTFSDTKMDMDPQITCGVAFDKSSPLPGADVIPAVGAAVNRASKICNELIADHRARTTRPATLRTSPEQG